MSIDEAAPQFGLGKSLLFSAILIVAVLGMAELGVRGWAYFFREEAQKYDPSIGSFVLVPGRHRTELGVVQINSEGFVGAELAADGPDLWRILAVGDSCTFGGGDDTHTYAVMLQRRLAARAAPGRRYEVVNGGISGLDSELVLNRLRAIGPGLDPEVVTIYAGWNDLMKFDPLGQSDAAGVASTASRLLDELWLAKGMRKLLFFHVRPRVRPPRTGPESRTGAFAEFRPTYYEDNLRAILADVRALGAKPVLTTLPTVVTEEMTLEEIRAANVVFPYFRAGYGVGDFLDLLAGYNRAIRRIATEEQVPLADLESAFARLPDRKPYFYDTMHTSPDGMDLIARDLETTLERAGLLGAGDAAAPPAGGP
jgi:lysophospholipase L1-like esterase